ncbi:unnamed protein product [Vitrella brassicaformis CCMP3155]|uniref:Uncharacterized protein n=1 Tax=Vitrella brassicaformis (strain CCMP3155) TaxID=1169540 RepID=A0A0G4EKD7_VITBC|nr:unnamed protein product [Vitrella brassicaformis CCMP3155]|eukprot:CEL96887.1 unnamed protein product [Vitrella brassicaformis CCMP3155]
MMKREAEPSFEGGSLKRPCTAEEVEKLIDTIAEHKRREYVYIARAVEHEREIHKERTQLQHWRDTHETQDGHLKSVLIDPFVNMEIKLQRERLLDKEERIRVLEEELQAKQFDQKDPVTGKRLINKLRTLKDENADLGKTQAEGTLQVLEMRLGILQKQNQLLRNKCKEQIQFMQCLDEENETMQNSLNQRAAQLQAERTRSADLERRLAEAEATIAQLRGGGRGGGGGGVGGDGDGGYVADRDAIMTGEA